LRVNPQDLFPGLLWKMDVTNFAPFGKLKYIHVTIDTFSGFIYDTLQTVEATKHVISHVISCLTVLPQHKSIKTDNGPGYTSNSLKQFCSQMGIKNITGIPYNPQGRALLREVFKL
jgi:transposase InsO family protein